MRVLFAILGIASASVIHAQFGLSVEEYHVHDSGELAGFTTYRVYFDCMNETDFLSACTGDEDNPLIISSTSGTWYNSPFNASCFTDDLNPAFFGAFPELEFDSFLTIGAESSLDLSPAFFSGETNICDEFVPSGENFETSFGTNVVVDSPSGTAWYQVFTPDSQNPGYAGEDLRVLVMQITTTGSISGQIYVQAFAEGDQSQEYRDLLSFDSNPGGGCTDSTECYFDPEATVDDGTCLQLDACGECGGPGIPDGSCDCEGYHLDAIGECGGSCLCDGNANGICDADEISGCTYVFADNYNPSASLDDGSCELSESEDGDCALVYDGNNDGVVGASDLLALLTEFGADCNGPNASFSCGSPVDYQGHTYETVLIGEQCWFAENLRATNLVSGEAIQQAQDTASWSNAEGPAWCYYENEGGVELDDFGVLYNFHVVQSGICPQGWRVPDRDDWLDEGLREWVAGAFPETGVNCGGLLRTVSPYEWNFPNDGAANAVGFNGRPSAGRDIDGTFRPFGSEAHFHMNNTFGGGNAEFIFIRGSNNIFGRSPVSASSPQETWKHGSAIRCLKND